MDDYQIEAVFSQPAHKGVVCCMDIQNQSELLASGGEDGNILLRPLQTGIDTETKGSSKSTVDSLCFTSPTTLLSSQSGQAYLWDLRKNNTPALSFKPLHSSKSNRGCKLWSIDKHPSQSHRIAAGDNLGTISVWDTRNPSYTLSSTEHFGNVWKNCILAPWSNGYHFLWG